MHTQQPVAWWRSPRALAIAASLAPTAGLIGSFPARTPALTGIAAAPRAEYPSNFTTPKASPHVLSRRLVIASWIARSVVTVVLFALFFKFTAAPESVYIFKRLGHEPVGRIGSDLVGAIASALLFVLARIAWSASAFLRCIHLSTLPVIDGPLRHILDHYTHFFDGLADERAVCMARFSSANSRPAATWGPVRGARACS